MVELEEINTSKRWLSFSPGQENVSLDVKQVYSRKMKREILVSQPMTKETLRKPVVEYEDVKIWETSRNKPSKKRRKNIQKDKQES